MGEIDKVRVIPKGIFLYVTLQCNCQCVTCYMQKHYSGLREISSEVAHDIIERYRSWGAQKLTLLGGEPTLYAHLGRIAEFAKAIGYSYVRIQTNGQFGPEVLTDTLVQKNVDTFCFSVDGPTEIVNGMIRKGCSLTKTLENMRIAKQIGYDVRANVTVTSINVDYVFDTIKLSEELEASVVYLNIAFPMGAAVRQNHLIVSFEKWNRVFNELKKNSSKFSAVVKVPVGYAYGDVDGHCCVALKFERLYVMPNGDCYPCILFVDKPKLRLGEKVYSKTLALYAGVTVEEMNSFCHFLPAYEGEPKSLCLYHKKFLGRGKSNF